MKPLSFWVRRFLVIAGLVTLIIVCSKLLRGFALEQVLAESFLWGLVSATILIATRYYYARKGVACAMCRDTPDA